MEKDWSMEQNDLCYIKTNVFRVWLRPWALRKMAWIWILWFSFFHLIYSKDFPYGERGLFTRTFLTTSLLWKIRFALFLFKHCFYSWLWRQGADISYILDGKWRACNIFSTADYKSMNQEGFLYLQIANLEQITLYCSIYTRRKLLRQIRLSWCNWMVELNG